MMRIRNAVFAAAAVMASASLSANANAQYRWCAVENSGGTACGFASVDQCRATVSGIGGSCEPQQIVPANLSPAGKAAAPKVDRSGGRDRLMDCVTQSCRINCSPTVKKRFQPKWCVYFKPPV